MKWLFAKLPLRVRANLFLYFFGIAKVPMIFYVRPRLLHLNEESVALRIPLRRRTRNHLRAMYFGVLCVGADCAGGLIAVWLIQQAKARVDFVFKSCQAEFLKRAEGDTVFTCNDGVRIREAVQQAIATGDRVNIPVEILATVPSKLGQEPVAKFALTLSVKRRA